ncbi:MAG: homocysteine S-methyltransferase family protein [Deltaproteobacteria bacterium]|nr:homocysteine S-methyltransferase family protein [Deltaproteobacteria bacterium]
MEGFRDHLKGHLLVMDGAMGTMLQQSGVLKAGMAPELLNTTHPLVIQGIHAQYVGAGANIIETNTFGANRVKLREFGVGHLVREINRAAVQNARAAAGDRAFVAGDIGPTGRFVMPIGDVEFDEAVDVYTEQAQALLESGVDLFSIETMMDIKEIRAAMVAIRGLCDLPVMAMMTFNEDFRTTLGTTPEVAAVVLDALGADVIGANCSLGPDGIYRVIKRMSMVTTLPLISEANAGMPILRHGVTTFPAEPHQMTEHMEQSVALGVRVYGGCCGTTPEHIRHIAETGPTIGRSLSYETRQDRTLRLASRTGLAELVPLKGTLLIGERINPTGKRAYSEELGAGRTKYIREQAMLQQQAGAHVLDVNVGVPGIDEPAMMARAIFAVNGASTLPVSIDSSDMRAVEAGLKAVDGKPLVNSVTGEPRRLIPTLKLIRKYGAAAIILPIDEKGLPKTARERAAIAKRVVEAAEKMGIKRNNLVVDALTLTISAEPGGGMETLRTIEIVSEELGLPCVGGLSNVSFGLPARNVLNGHFLSMAMSQGIGLAIVNVLDEDIRKAYLSASLLLGRDERARRFIEALSPETTAPRATAAGGPTTGSIDIFKQISDAVIKGDEENITAIVEQALAQGNDPVTVSNKGLVPGMDVVGQNFKSGKIFLPQVMLSAETMKKAFARLKQDMKRQERGTKKVIMATVEGDIHDIGKNIVITLLENSGFEVIDLGKNVSTKEIVQRAKDNGADMVGLSALMTTTMTEMGSVVKALRQNGLSTPVAVGGAVVTAEYAREIGADLYAKDAMTAVERIKGFFGIR